MTYSNMLDFYDAISIGTNNSNILGIINGIDNNALPWFDDRSLDEIVLGAVDGVTLGANVGVKDGASLGVPLGTKDGSLGGTSFGFHDGNTNDILLGNYDGPLDDRSLSTEGGVLLCATVGINNGNTLGYDDGTALGSINCIEESIVVSPYHHVS